MIVYAVWTFRVQPDDDTDGPPIHGHTGLEIAWTVVPAVLVIAIGVVSAVVLSQNADAGNDPLKVQGVRAAVRLAVRVRRTTSRSNELVLPVDRDVEFEMDVGRRDPLVLDPARWARSRTSSRASTTEIVDHADADRAASR